MVESSWFQALTSRLSVRTAAIALTVCLGALVAGAQTKSSEELALFPTSVTMAGDEERVIQAATRSGKIPAHVEWSISNPAVATMTTHGSSTADVKALSAAVRSSRRASTDARRPPR